MRPEMVVSSTATAYATKTFTYAKTVAYAVEKLMSMRKIHICDYVTAA